MDCSRVFGTLLFTLIVSTLLLPEANSQRRPRGSIFWELCQRDFASNLCFGTKNNQTTVGGGQGCFLTQDCTVFVIGVREGGRFRYLLSRSEYGYTNDLVDRRRYRMFFTRQPYTITGPNVVPRNVLVAQAARKPENDPEGFCATVQLPNRSQREPCNNGTFDYTGNSVTISFARNPRGQPAFGHNTANFTSPQVITVTDPRTNTQVYQVRPLEEPLYAHLILEAWRSPGRVPPGQTWIMREFGSSPQPFFLFGRQGPVPSPTEPQPQPPTRPQPQPPTRPQPQPPTQPSPDDQSRPTTQPPGEAPTESRPAPNPINPTDAPNTDSIGTIIGVMVGVLLLLVLLALGAHFYLKKGKNSSVNSLGKGQQRVFQRTNIKNGNEKKPQVGPLMDSLSDSQRSVYASSAANLNK